MDVEAAPTLQAIQIAECRIASKESLRLLVCICALKNINALSSGVNQFRSQERLTSIYLVPFQTWLSLNSETVYGLFALTDIVLTGDVD